MKDAGGQPSGAAQRRSQRRLRSCWRHVSALAASTHQSAQRNAALRGQNTGARARAGEVNETHDATTPHPGVRPGILQAAEECARTSWGVGRGSAGGQEEGGGGGGKEEEKAGRSGSSEVGVPLAAVAASGARHCRDGSQTHRAPRAALSRSVVLLGTESWSRRFARESISQPSLAHGVAPVLHAAGSDSSWLLRELVGGVVSWFGMNLTVFRRRDSLSMRGW